MMYPKRKSQRKLVNTRLKNNKAFGIIEVLVATSLLSLVSLGIVTLLTEAMKTQRGLQAKDAQHEVMGEITQHLGNNEACLNTFVGINPTASVSVSALKNAGPPATATARYTVGEVHSSKLLQYKKFELVGYDPTDLSVNLAVTLTKLGSVSGVKDIQQKIRFKITLDASNNIATCSAIGGNGFWMASSANPNDIYYNGGKVGIGTTTPAVKLDVSGTIRPQAASLNGACSQLGEQAYNAATGAPMFCNTANKWAAAGVKPVLQDILYSQEVGNRT